MSSRRCFYCLKPIEVDELWDRVTDSEIWCGGCDIDVNYWGEKSEYMMARRAEAEAKAKQEYIIARCKEEEEEAKARIRYII